MSSKDEILSYLAEFSQTDKNDWFLVFRARHGMELAFESIRETCGMGSAVTQLLTCCAAVDPIIVSGLLPEYAEISVDNASIDPALLSMHDETRAVVLQHTYGIVDQRQSQHLIEKAHAVGSVVVEDCAHCLGRMARNESGRPIADVSVHSFGVEKVLDTSFGGAVWVNPDTPFADMAIRLRTALSSLDEIGSELDRKVKHYRTCMRLINHSGALSHTVRNFLYAVGLFDPAVSDEERRGVISHKPMAPSIRVCNRINEILPTLSKNYERRRTAVTRYRELLLDIDGVEIPQAVISGDPQPLLKVPILVADTALAEKVDSYIVQAGFWTQTWYRPELGPGVLDARPYRLPADRSGVVACDDFIARLACLPTDIDVDDVSRVVDALVAALDSHKS